MKNPALSEDIQRCTQCAAIFRSRWADPTTQHIPLMPKPIVSQLRSAPIMLVGQAPGKTEFFTGQPFQGDAGKRIRQIFETCGLASAQFDRLVYQTAVTKCFPGRKCSKAGGEEDIRPSAKEIKLCLPFLKQEIEQVQPQLLVLLGSVAIDAYLRLKGEKYNHYPQGLSDFIGHSENLGGMRVIFLPHTSGASRWQNKPANRQLYTQAKHLLQNAISALTLS